MTREQFFTICNEIRAEVPHSRGVLVASSVDGVNWLTIVGSRNVSMPDRPPRANDNRLGATRP